MSFFYHAGDEFAQYGHFTLRLTQCERRRVWRWTVEIDEVDKVEEEEVMYKIRRH